MEITYLGHSCFKLKGKNGTVIMDPYEDYVGLALPNLSADVVTVSHQHQDHNAFKRVKGTARRERPFIIQKPGAYEIENISVFGYQSYHDENQGAQRGPNYIYVVLIDDIRVCHLGDLGHELDVDLKSELGVIDVLFCPVGGVFTLAPKSAVKVISALDPSYIIPMHYKTNKHNLDVFGDLATLTDFTKEYGAESQPIDVLKIEKTKLPEETELVILNF